MLSDFTKLQTFMIVVKEKSFSKASSKLGISQPAVTQQIKFIEQYFNTKVINRKRNGIQLTRDGENLLIVAQKIEKFIALQQKEMMKTIKRDDRIKIMSSYTIGNFLLPKCIDEIKEEVYSNIDYSVNTSKEAIEGLLNKTCDLALVESMINNDNIVYREWVEDELVLASTSQLPRLIRREDLYSHKWLILAPSTQTSLVIQDYLEKLELDKDKLNIIGEFDSFLEIKKNILKMKEKHGGDLMTFLPYLHIKDELQARELFTTKIRGLKCKRKLYVASLKERRNDALIENISDYIVFNTKVALH
ncbi:LysR family transcriptional regulator [Helicobacter burdigaliensis]|uniref:LysR family transcriptional regulator n=1 Tax=Helicobacter burdigaliensis TaxID=2315334 RepID=UPI000EF752A3|nr:LysR family transcriptional regulator [Helicobacter burdigaliensis]